MPETEFSRSSERLNIAKGKYKANYSLCLQMPNEPTNQLPRNMKTEHCTILSGIRGIQFSFRYLGEHSEGLFDCFCIVVVF